jgi:hypothetical protein
MTEAVTPEAIIWDIGYSDRSFSWFSSVHRGKFRDNMLNYGMTISFHIVTCTGVCVTNNNGSRSDVWIY